MGHIQSGVPSSPNEYASEPSDWDPNHIRSTWIKNVGNGG